MNRKEGRAQVRRLRQERNDSGVRQFHALGLQAAARRVQAGEYIYRHFVIEDQGAGGSLHAKAAAYSGRWVIRQGVRYPIIKHSRHYSLREAKREVDRAYRSAMAPTGTER